MAGLRSIAGLGSLGPPSPRGVVPHPPPPAKSPGRPLPGLREPTLAPRGPALLHLGQRRDTHGGPGPPPVLFVGSAAEWVWYYASARYHNDPKDPTLSPNAITTGRARAEDDVRQVAAPDACVTLVNSARPFCGRI